MEHLLKKKQISNNNKFYDLEMDNNVQVKKNSQFNKSTEGVENLSEKKSDQDKLDNNELMDHNKYYSKLNLLYYLTIERNHT